MKKFILSIDQGTTSSKVVLYNKNFQIIDYVQKEFKQYFPKDGWVEHDAVEIWKDVKNLINKLINKKNINSSDIISIGITNQRETTVLWDKKTGKPVNKAIVWQDRRTSDYCKKLINFFISSLSASIPSRLIFFSKTLISSPPLQFLINLKAVSPRVKYLFLKASYNNQAGEPSSLLFPLSISKSSLKYGMIICRLIVE